MSQAFDVLVIGGGPGGYIAQFVQRNSALRLPVLNRMLLMTLKVSPVWVVLA